MPSRDQIARAAALIRDGGLVAFPTETVYGLGANALDPAAVARIYEAKGRPPASPLIVHVSSAGMARSLAAEWPAAAAALADRYWPGPLTLVVPKLPVIPDIVTAGLATVGLRMPKHPVALALIVAAGVPIAAPSANRFTGLSPTTAAHVRASLGDRVEMILDGGPCEVGIESTVVAVKDGEVTLLRPGMVDIGVRSAGKVEEGGAHPSPGMHERHYAPRTPLYQFPLSPTPPGRGIVIRRDDMPHTPAGYARELYARLHRLDGEGWDWIAIEAPSEEPKWAAIRDRLRRATHS
ncbi:MAG: L-threonylcarbamoyladenylate synthase [Bryobacteraceae bacterium]